MLRAFFFFICFLPLVLSIGGKGAAQEIFLFEEFNNLQRWKNLYFRNIKEHTQYKILQKGGETFLQLKSEHSASGLILKEKFDVYRFPLIQWRWKTQKVYKKAHLGTKQGDDYPLRLYILFQYKPPKGFSLRKMLYAFLKGVYGEYPPDSALSFVWSSKVVPEQYYSVPGFSDTRIYPIDSGTEKINVWQEHSVNIVEEYRKAFQKEPPETVSLGIMNDSDNTGETAISFIDFIQVSSE